MTNRFRLSTDDVETVLGDLQALADMFPSIGGDLAIEGLGPELQSDGTDARDTMHSEITQVESALNEVISNAEAATRHLAEWEQNLADAAGDSTP